MPTYCNELVVGGQVKFSLKDDTVTDPSHIMAGYIGHLADGRQVLGTGQSGPSATQHTIEFEFTDGTSTALTGYWDAAFVTSAITATIPETYGDKPVETASLDGTIWYTKPTGSWVVMYDDECILWPDSVDIRGETSYPFFGEGETWRFTYGDNTYECETQSYNGDWVIGNVAMTEDIDAPGLPFFMGRFEWGWYSKARTGVDEMTWSTAKLEKWVTN